MAFAIVLISLLLLWAVAWLGLYAMENDSIPAGVLCVILIAACVGGIVCKDEADERKPFDGYIAEKRDYPASTTYVMVGKVMMPTTKPERWNLVLRDVKGERRSCDVSAMEYEALSLGAMFHCGD